MNGRKPKLLLQSSAPVDFNESKGWTIDALEIVKDLRSRLNAFPFTQ